MKLSNAKPIDVFDGAIGDGSDDFSRHYKSNGAEGQEFSVNNALVPISKHRCRRPFSINQLHGLTNRIDAASDTALAKFLLELVCQLLAPDEQRYKRLYKVLLSAFQHHGALLSVNSVHSEVKLDCSSMSASAASRLERDDRSHLRRLLYNLIMEEVGATGLRLPDAAFLASTRLTRPFSSLREGLGPNSSFIFLNNLGSGAFGRVLKVLCLHDNREYALKEVLLDEALSADKAKRHLREVENLAKLDHPHVVRYFSCWFECVEARSRFDKDDLDRSTTSARQSDSADASVSRRDASLREADSYVIFQRSASDNKKKKKMMMMNENSDCCKVVHRQRKASRHGWVYKLCIQMQYCEDTLAHWLRRRSDVICNSSCSPLDLVRSADNAYIVGQLFQGVAYLHEKHIIHRDLKPPNIFFELKVDRPRVRIGDFGLSRLWKNDGTSSRIGEQALHSTLEPFNDLSMSELDGKTRLTGTQGTLLYMSPEMEKGGHYGPETDIYSLGVVMYELYHPFGTEYERVLCLQKLRECGGHGVPEYARELARRWPVEVQLITDMVSELAPTRPTASQLVQRYLQWLTSNTSADASSQRLSLREEVLLKLLEQRDNRICQLEAEIKQLKIVCLDDNRN